MVEQIKSENPMTTNPTDLLTINDGMKKQMNALREERVNENLDDEVEPLKVQVSSEKDVKELKKLVGEKNIVQEVESFDKIELNEKKVYDDAKKNLDTAKESMEKLRSSLDENERKEDESDKKSEWHIKETVKEAAEDAKEYVENAVDYMKHLVIKEKKDQEEEEEKPVEKEEKQEEEDQPKTITEKIVDTLETGAEKVLSVFGLGGDKKSDEENK